MMKYSCQFGSCAAPLVLGMANCLRLPGGARRRARSARSSSPWGGREMMSLWEKWKPFLPKFSRRPLVLSLSHSFLLPIRSFRLPSSPSRGGFRIRKRGLHNALLIAAAPPALTRSENPIFTAAKKNERNGKERREEESA